MMDEARQRYYTELKINLARLGLTAEQQENGMLEVKTEDTLLCYVHDDGSVGYNSEVSSDEALSALKDKVSDQARTVAEYMRLMEKAPMLIASGLEDQYKLLADFNGTVLAGMNSRYGVQFVTWEWDHDGAGVHWGHYHSNSYESAKEDFAVRSGMIHRERLFSDAQLAEVYPCIHETLENHYPMTEQRRTLLTETAQQIERAVYDLSERVNLSYQKEWEYGCADQSEDVSMCGAEMDKNAFWALIDRVNAEAEGSDQDRILELTEQKLMELPSSEIRGWYSIQREYADMAYRNDLWAAYGAISAHCSDDGFIDFRSWLISQGQEVYMTALHDPDSLAERDFAFSDVEFESYGYIAAYAYAKKTLLEQAGPEALKQQYDEWWSKNSEEITAQFESKTISEEEQKRYLERWFRSYLTIQHDVHAAAEQNPLSKECLASIWLDQNTKPDINPNWTLDDLPEIVPKLYAKYNSPDMMTTYTVHI